MVGRTSLFAVTLSNRDSLGPGVHAKVLRGTFSMQPNLRSIELRYKYTFPLAQFEALRKRVRQPTWFVSLNDLLYRRTDLSARHVSQQLELCRSNWADGLDGLDTKSGQWREPRLLDFGFAMPKNPRASSRQWSMLSVATNSSSR